jgi:hypothetical protein
MRNRLAVSSLFFVCIALAACKSEPRGPKAPPGPVQQVSDQDEALDAAREMDLPALKGAESLIVETMKWAGGKRKIVEDGGTISKFDLVLTVSKVPPSGGETWARLTWQKGGQAVRSVWVYLSGEWGFERPGTDWTTGLNPDLVRLIKDILGEK